MRATGADAPASSRRTRPVRDDVPGRAGLMPRAEEPIGAHRWPRRRAPPPGGGMWLLPVPVHRRPRSSWPPAWRAVWRAVGTWANLATVLRTAVCVPLGLVGVVAPSRSLLVTAYAVYWLGDV